MKKHKLFPFLRWRMCHSLLATSLATALSLAGCSAENNETADHSLPEGKYPMTFSTAVEGLSVTRATADNTWQGNEEVAVQVDGAVKKYKPTSNGTSTTLQAAEPTTPFYWQTSDETKAVSAWYLGTSYQEELPTTWTVKPDQSGDGYQESDFLYAPETSISFAGRNTTSLPFYHQTAKVVMNIIKNEFVTSADQIEDVSLVNMNMAADYTVEGKVGTWSNFSNPAENGITPKSLAVATDNKDNILQSYAALVIPQDMATKQFIKVTVGGTPYYYTPSTGEATLQSGKQHTYNITVTGVGLEVTTTAASVSWQDEPQSSDTPVEAKIFRVTFSSSVPLPELKLNGIEKIDEPNNVYKIIEGNSFSFSYTVPEVDKKAFSVRGLAEDIGTAVHNGGITYTYTYTNVCSDLCLEYGELPLKVGDYYYADGSWASVHILNSASTCIGIVFKVGAHETDNASKYDGILKDGIHGYVVALQDAHTGACSWGGFGMSLGTSTNQNDYSGYTNSKKILKKENESSDIQFPAMSYISKYVDSVPTPENSSSWYFPSSGQLKDIYKARAKIEGKMSLVGGSWFKSSGYLSSCETRSTQYNCSIVSFKDGSNNYEEKNNGGNIRAILTF